MHVHIFKCVRGACLCSSATLVIISYAWRPNPRWHLECSAKGGTSVQFSESTVDGNGSAEERRKHFVHFLSNWTIPTLCGETDSPERRREAGMERKGRKRGSAWVFGYKGACCAWWCCGTFACVYMWGVWWTPTPVLAWGPTQQGLCGWGLWRGSFLVGTQLLVSQREQGLLNAAFLDRLTSFSFYNSYALDFKIQKIPQRGKASQSLLNTRWKPCCILTVYIQLWSDPRGVSLYIKYIVCVWVCVCVCACVSQLPLSAC